MSTENGISKIYSEEERFENYADGHVSPHVRFSEAASAYTSWGRLAVWYEQRRLAVQSRFYQEEHICTAVSVFPNCL